jgi:hypothetical protein
MLLLMPLARMLIGAATGAVSGSLSACGISDQFVKDLGAKLQPVSSVLILPVRKSTLAKVLPEVSKCGGMVLHTSLSHDAEAHLQAALDAVEPARAGRPVLMVGRSSHAGHPRAHLVGGRTTQPLRGALRGGILHLAEHRFAARTAGEH